MHGFRFAHKKMIVNVIQPKSNRITKAACVFAYSFFSNRGSFVSAASLSSERLPSTFVFSSRRYNNQSSLRMSSSIASSTSSLTIAQLPCLDDNYGYLIHDPATGNTAAVDTPDVAVYEKELKERGWKLSHIFNTHHHWDHTGGNLELKKSHEVKIHGPSNENIPGCDVGLSGGDEITSFGNDETKIQVIDVGGHTNGHIAYYFPNDNVLFSGDALFALGCGKMFEGNPTQFWESLKRLRVLPDETVVYCAHEYTQSNAKFAISVEPGNPKLVSRVDEINSKRQRGEPTVPSLLGVEKETNPFLRVDVSDEIRNNVGAVDGEGNDVTFGKVRKAKDNFRG